MIRQVLIILLLISSTPSEACVGRIMPFKENPELYTDIFVAIVAKVEVTSGPFAIGFGPKHTLTVNITRTVKGNKRDTVILKDISGCGLLVPKVGQSTTFYLQGDWVIPDNYSPSSGLEKPNLFGKDGSDG